MSAERGELPRTWGQHGTEPTGVRPGCVVGFVLIAVGLAIGIAYGASGLRGGGIDLGYVEDYPLASVVYRSTDGLFRGAAAGRRGDRAFRCRSA